MHISTSVVVSSFQSTPSAWRETWRGHVLNQERYISIHSLRMEGDISVPVRPRQIHPFQSTPSAWRETHCAVLDCCFMAFQSTPSAWRETQSGTRAGIPIPQFQSTPSAWRETTLCIIAPFLTSYFNPLPPHGGRLCNVPVSDLGGIISIHSLRMEGDWK